jgi:LysR family transcriptional regulator, hypochlorite-specific transcription factor HypT
MIDLLNLKNFVVLCQVRNFSRAAERCHVSTSGLSRRISGLENWVGAPLFVRSSPSLELTEAGTCLLDVAAQVVAALEGARELIQGTQLHRPSVFPASPQCNRPDLPLTQRQ